jgi:hypothetical protein
MRIMASTVASEMYRFTKVPSFVSNKRAIPAAIAAVYRHRIRGGPGRFIRRRRKSLVN